MLLIFTLITSITYAQNTSSPLYDYQSALLFCDDSKCSDTDTQPFTPIVANTSFYLMHEITEPDFQYWFILNPRIIASQQNTTLNTSITQFRGYNIYSILPIVGTNISITAYGYLSKSSQNIFNQNNSNNLTQIQPNNAYPTQALIINNLVTPPTNLKPTNFTLQSINNDSNRKTNKADQVNQLDDDKQNSPQVKNCDSNTLIIQNGSCASQKCLQQKLQVINPTVSSIVQQTQNFIQTAQVVSNQNASLYIVTIQYSDDKNNQILGGQCIDYRIFSIKNNASIDSTRQFINLSMGDGQVPTWPQYSYQYIQQFGAQITFSIKQSDMQSICSNTLQGNYIDYKCYFELAFLLGGNTLVSYYFSIDALISASLVGTSLPPTNLIQFIQNMKMVDSQSIKVSVNSTLLFCDSFKCLQTNTKPFSPLTQDTQFYIKHIITDQSFVAWNIQFPLLSLQSFSMTIQYSTQQLTTNYYPGYNIYNLTVPLVSANVMITASGTLKAPVGSRFLASDDQDSFVYDSINTGKITPKNQMIQVDTNARDHQISSTMKGMNTRLLEIISILILAILNF